MHAIACAPLLLPDPQNPRRQQYCQVLAELEEWRAKLWFDAAASGSEEQLQRLLELGQDVNDDSSDTCSSGLDGTALHHATLKANCRPRALDCIAPAPDSVCAN